MYRFPWYLTLVSTNHASSNPGQVGSIILHWYACGADRLSGGRSVYGHLITKFSRMGSLPH